MVLSIKWQKIVKIACFACAPNVTSPIVMFCPINSPKPKGIQFIFTVLSFTTHKSLKSSMFSAFADCVCTCVGQCEFKVMVHFLAEILQSAHKQKWFRVMLPMFHWWTQPVTWHQRWQSACQGFVYAVLTRLRGSALNRLGVNVAL